MKISFRCSHENPVVFCVCVCIVAVVVVVVAYLGNAVGKKVEVAISQVERMPNILRAAAVLSCPFLLLSLCSSLVFPPSVTQDFAYV